MTEATKKTSSPPVGYPARIVAALGLALWVASLTQTSLVIDNGTSSPESLSGISILGVGWVALIYLCVAWVANLTFIIATVLLLVTRTTVTILSLLSVLLAADMFRVTEFPGSGRAEVYAYGLGVVLWLASMLVLLVAAGLRKVEIAQGRIFIQGLLRSPMAPVGVVALAVLIVLSAKWTLDDKQGASVTERRFLATALFKRGEVCKSTVAPAIRSLNLDGPLEIVGRGYPLDSPRLYLSWGIPTVRRQGFDYSLMARNDLGTVFATPSAGFPELQIRIEQRGYKEGKFHIETLRATLVTPDGGKVGFDQTWTRGGPTGRLYCPDLLEYSSNPSGPPRDLLASVIRTPGGVIPPTKVMRPVFDGLGWPPAKAQLTAVKRVGPMEFLDNNTGCAGGVGIIPETMVPVAARANGLATHGFRIGDRYHLLNHAHPLFAVCNGQDVYLYYSSARTDSASFLVSVQKRSIKNFDHNWTTRIDVNYEGQTWHKGGRSALRVQSITEDHGSVVMEILNAQTWELLRIKFDVPARS